MFFHTLNDGIPPKSGHRPLNTALQTRFSCLQFTLSLHATNNASRNFQCPISFLFLVNFSSIAKMFLQKDRLALLVSEAYTCNSFCFVLINAMKQELHQLDSYECSTALSLAVETLLSGLHFKTHLLFKKRQ